MDMRDINQLEYINLGKFSEKELDEMLSFSYSLNNLSSRIDYLSSKLLDIDYKEKTLIGEEDEREVFVVNLEFLDCLTFLEYVEAMRLSRCYKEFVSNLKKVRYIRGIVSYETRNHFFTDWIESNAERIIDMTCDVGGGYTLKINKFINLREDNTNFVSGVPVKKRNINYIPKNCIDRRILERLKTGDYIGIYSELEGLDVSHVGIFISKDGEYRFRHASSKIGIRKVIDQDFLEYINNKPGIIILRPY